MSTGHLRLHGLTAKTYGQKWPGAPLYSPLAKKKRLEHQRDWVNRQDPDNLRLSKKKHYLTHREKYIAASVQRHKENPGAHKKAQAKHRAKPESKAKAKGRKLKHWAKMKRSENLIGMDLKTGFRVSLVAHRLLEGASLWAMKDDIYPDSSDPFNAIKRLRANHKATIESERQRVAALPEDLLRHEADDLRIRLRDIG